LKLGVAENFRDGPVIAGGVKLALIVAPAQMQSERDPRMLTDDSVVHLDGQIEQAVGIVAALPVSFAEFRIQQCSVLRRIDLNIGAPQANQLLHLVAQKVD